MDLWALGCTYAEMLRSTDPYKRLKLALPDKYLFCGDSCFPLSPSKAYYEAEDKSNNLVTQGDQMLKILEMVPPLDNM